jgi:hypothetical protein
MDAMALQGMGCGRRPVRLLPRLRVTRGGRSSLLRNGTGGTWVSHFGETDPHSRFRYNGDLGAMIVDASADRLVLRYVNRWGHILDELTLSR